MTARAKPLTNRATPAAGASDGRWTMSSADTRAFVQTFGRLGYDTAWLLASSGVSDADLADPDARVSCEAIGLMMSSAQKQRFTPNLGLELARHTPLGAYPMLDYLVVTSDTVGTGIGQLGRYFRLVGNPTTIETAENDELVLVRIGDEAGVFTVEFTASLMVLHFRDETDGQFAATRLTLRHTPDDTNTFARILGCEIETGAPWSGLTVPRAAWALPLRRRDPLLRGLLEAQANEILARLPDRAGLAGEVQRVLARTVGADASTIDRCARKLAMSGRTLQRRLAAEGVSYQQLLNGARKESARRYLSDPTLAICEIAYLLGYSEPAPFHRAFRRWYGVTPETFRKRYRSTVFSPATDTDEDGNGLA